MAVAQLVESQIVILVVVGSSPISHPKKSRNEKGTSVPFSVSGVVRRSDSHLMAVCSDLVWVWSTRGLNAAASLPCLQSRSRAAYAEGSTCEIRLPASADVPAALATSPGPANASAACAIGGLDGRR